MPSKEKKIKKKNFISFNYKEAFKQLKLTELSTCAKLITYDANI